MNPKVIKVCILTLASMAGLLGLAGFAADVAILAPHSMDASIAILLLCVSTALSAYLIYVAYLAWFRWSPLAVRHVIGILAYAIFSVAASRLGFARTGIASFWLILPCLLCVFVFYRWLALFCSARLFPSASIQTSASSAWKFALAFIAFAAALGLMVFSWQRQLPPRLLPAHSRERAPDR